MALTQCGTITYSLQNAVLTAIDATVFTFDQLFLTLTISTSDLTKVGIYNMVLIGT